MNITRYNEIIEKLKSCVKYYDNVLQNDKFYLGLANGDSINLTFPKNHIAHLLGVHTDELKSAGIINTSSSYDILKKLINDDLTYISIKNANKNFDFNSLFSEYIDSKIEIFNDILKVRTDDLYFVIKYISSRTYTTGEEKENSDYFIIRKHSNGLSVLGIVKSTGLNNYVPVTSRLFKTHDELDVFLTKVIKNQEITYPYTFRVENYGSKFSANGYTSLDDKLKYNKILNYISSRFDAIPSNNRDFITIIEKSLNSRQKSYNNTSILNLIKENIKNGNIIDKDEVSQILDDSKIPDDLESLIDACNDFICSNCNNEYTNNSYSSIQNENTSLKEQLEKLKQELLESKKENSELTIRCADLEEANNSNSFKLKILTDAYKSICN